MTTDSCIKKVAVIGEGRMGTGIIQSLQRFPFELVWICSNGTDILKLHKQNEKRAYRSFDSGIISESDLQRQLKTDISTSLSSAVDCDLIIEAITENVYLKKELFRQLSSMTQESTIMVSNSSSILPSLISPESSSALRFAGLHFFYPVQYSNIAELIPSAATSHDTIIHLEKFLDRISLRYLFLKENDAFFLNRLFLEVQNEGFRLVEEGNVTIEQIDFLVRENLFSFGLFDFCDSVGIDIMSTAVGNYTCGYPDRERYLPFLERLQQLLAEGKTGMKAGEGFYQYPRSDTRNPMPENELLIVDHLRQIWLSAVRRYTATAQIPIDDVNHACKQYFGIDKGPFD